MSIVASERIKRSEVLQWQPTEEEEQAAGKGQRLHAQQRGASSAP